MESEEYRSERLDISSNDPCFSSLNSVRRKNLRRIIFAHLNTNSLRNKFDFLVDQVKVNVDILLMSESKLDESSPEVQFKFLFCCCCCCCFYLDFLSRTFTNHRTAGEGGRHLFDSSLPLPPASQTLRH